MADAAKRPAEDAGALVEAKRARTGDAGALTSVNRNSVPIREGPVRTSGLLAPTMLLTGHKEAVLGIDFSPSGDLLASCAADGAVFLWRTYGECENVASLRGHRLAATGVRWCLGGEAIASVGADCAVRLWDTETGAAVRSWKGHREVINAVAAPRSGGVAARGEGGAREDEGEGEGGGPAGGPLPGGASRTAAAQPYVLSGADDGTARLWDARVPKQAAATIEERYQVLAVDLPADASSLWTGSLDGCARAYDLRKPSEPRLVLAGHGEAITGLALSPALTDASHLATTAEDGAVRVWDARPYAPRQRCTAVLAGTVRTHERNLLRVAWSPDGARVAAGSGDASVNIWEPSSGQLLYKLPGHKGSANDVAFHPLEPILASASSDKTIYLGELAE